MKILVTGCAGFIGSHLVDKLIESGHDVVIIDNLSSGILSNVNTKAKFFNMNIADDNIKELFSEFNFEIIYHLASQIDLNLSVKDPVSDAETNIIGTLNLLQNSVKSGVRKFIFSSSGGAIYGEQTSFPANESHPAKPQSPYGISKLTVEKYLDFYNNIYGLKYFILRYSNVYGPRQNLNGECGVVSIFCRKILSGKQPLINGDGLQTRDFVYVDDVVKANIMVLDYNESKILNISSGKETTINELYQIISLYFICRLS